MSCRERPSSSLSTSLARLENNGMPDAAVLSIFHELRRAGRAFSEQTDEDRRSQYSDLLYEHEQRIDAGLEAGYLTEARAASLRGRLEAARTAEVPDTATLYALRRLRAAVGTRAQALDSALGSYATQAGITTEQMRAIFAEAERNAPRRRGRNATGAGASPVEDRVISRIANDPGLQHAVVVCRDTAHAVQIRRLAEQPQRIEMAPTNAPGEHEGLRITSVGYDPRVHRLQVAVQGPDGVEQYAYRNVTAEEAAAVSSEGGTRVWAESLRGRPTHQYRNALEAAEHGVAPRCDRCGQFANASHACPAPTPTNTLSPWTSQSRWSRQRHERTVTREDGTTYSVEDSISLPAIREFRSAIGEGPLEINGISQWISRDSTGNSGYVSGNAVATLNADAEGGVEVQTAGLRCNCIVYRNNHDCEHVRAVADTIRARAIPTTRSRASMTPEERERAQAEAAARAEAAAVQDWTRQPETLADAAATWRREAEVLYSEDPAAFRQDYQAALESRAAKDGGVAIPYMTENALDGMARRGSGQGFGVEIEFEYPRGTDYNTIRENNARIARELYEAGITREPSQVGYGASRRYGFVDSHTQDDGVTGTWSFERDGSVNGGELVTPVMYDEPETWEKMAKAVEIIRRNGGVASTHAGAHVHVGTSMFQGSTAAYTEMARLTKQHEDVYMRLASNPERGTHRGNAYSRPNTNDVPADGFADVRSVRSWQGGRYSAVNYAHVQGGDSDHPEFRLFDSSIDAGTLQSQIKLAVATTHAAARQAAAGGTSRGTEAWGSHKKRAQARGSRRRLTDEEFDADSATTRSLLDTLFRRREDKQQMAALYAHTKWSAKRGR